MWLVWLKRDDLARIVPQSWLPGLAWLAAGLLLWAMGRAADIALFAQAGLVAAFQGAAIALLGPRVALILAFPILYAGLLVPFGDEIIPALQFVTAEMTTALTVWSGISTVADGIHIDTPAGLFIVAEECSGVKFLIAMVALGLLVAYARMAGWKRRALLLIACVIVPIVANALRAWATIFVAQYVGAEAAGGFDHIVYGWFFFAIVIAIVLGIAWRWFERDAEDAGWTAADVAQMGWLDSVAKQRHSAVLVAILALALIFGFAALLRLV